MLVEEILVYEAVTFAAVGIGFLIAARRTSKKIEIYGARYVEEIREGIKPGKIYYPEEVDAVAPSLSRMTKMCKIDDILKRVSIGSFAGLVATIILIIFVVV